MLPVEECRQPSCFQTQTVQAQFVFDSSSHGLLFGVAHSVWEHPIIQLCVHPRVQLLKLSSLGWIEQTHLGQLWAASRATHTHCIVKGFSGQQGHTREEQQQDLWDERLERELGQRTQAHP